MKWQNIFKFGKKIETLSTKIITVEYMGKKQKALLYIPYGMFMNQPNEGLNGILADQGNEESLMALPTDIENREPLEGADPLEEGEIAIGIPNKQNRIYFRNDNSVTTINENGSQTLAEDGSSEIENDKGSLSLNADGVITAENDNGSITLEADGTITIDNSKDINITSATNVLIEAGVNATLKAGALLTLESGDAAPWQPNVLPVDPLTGAPHGGAGAGIAKLKGA